METQHTISQQIEEFLARGGQITEVPMGASGEFGPAPAPKTRASSLRAPSVAGYLILSEAAKRLGISSNSLSRWIRDGLLSYSSPSQGHSRAKYVKESDVIALKKSREDNKSLNKRTYVNLKQAAQILGVHATTITKYVNAGTLTIEKLNLLDKHSKLIKTSAVLALKQSIRKGNK